VTYEVVWSDEAFAAAEGFLIDDRVGLASVFDAVDGLGVEPRPPAAFAWGGDLFRLRVGRYRVIYTVHAGSRFVEVIHLGRAI